MAHLHFQIRTRVQSETQIPHLMATLYYAEHVYIAQTQTRITNPYLRTGQES